MASLRRHQLARLSDAGWSAVLARPWDAQARDCLAHWAEHHLPLVVTRQPVDAGATDPIALGLPAPGRWGRRRLALHVPCAAVLRFDELPCLAEAQGLLPRSARGAVCDLLVGLAECHVPPRVFGSYGWQSLSGLDHLRPSSDLDVWVAVEDAAHADAVICQLQSFAVEQPRLDGELVFGDGAAVAWREWADWRAGRSRAVMVKRLTGVVLQRDTSWCERADMPALMA